jgi:hypothetical protein
MLWNTQMLVDVCKQYPIFFFHLACFQYIAQAIFDVGMAEKNFLS